MEFKFKKDKRKHSLKDEKRRFSLKEVIQRRHSVADYYPEYASTELQFWISQQLGLPDISDHAIQVFLHSCFYSLNDTKNTITSFYSIRRKTPEVFSDRDERVINYGAGILFFVKLPGLTDDGNKVFFIGLRHNDATNYVSSDVIKYMIMALEMCLFHDELYHGIIVLVDGEHFTFSHLRKTNMRILKTIFQYFQEALAARLKKLVLINVAKPIDILFGLVEPILSNKLLQIIERHNKESKKYLEYLPQSILPVELNGENKSVAELHDEMVQDLLDKKWWFEREDNNLNLLIEKQPRRQSVFNDISKLF